MPKKTSPKRTPGQQLCGALKKSGDKKGKPCARRAGWGTDHVGTGRCRSHGGGSPNGKKAAARELADLRAIEISAGTPIEVAPIDALLWSLYSATALCQSSRETMIAVMEDPDTPPTQRKVAREIYEEALDRQQKYAESCVRLGVTQAQIDMIETAGDQIMALLQLVLADLEVPMEQARPVLARRLRELSTSE